MWRKWPSILLRPHAWIKYNVTYQTFPQPLTKRSCKTEVLNSSPRAPPLCIFCGSRQLSIENECDHVALSLCVAGGVNGALCVRALRISSQQCDLFVFISMGLKITFHWFGLMSWRIWYKYSQSWNAVLCNNRRTRSEQQQSSRSEQRKRYSSQKTSK